MLRQMRSVAATAALLLCATAVCCTAASLPARVAATLQAADASAASMPPAALVDPAAAPMTSEVALPSSLTADPFPCSYTAPDGAFFDFSALKTATGTQAPGSNNDNYNMNVCGPVTGSSDCTGSSVCFQFKYFPSDWYAIAMYTGSPAPTYSLATPGSSAAGVLLTFANAQYNGDQVQVAFKFICATTPGAATTYKPIHDSNSHWTITVTSTEACAKPKPGGGGGSGGGMSGGWVFVIILLVSTSVYVIGGCVFKHQKQGTQGMESCPNIDFWREVPGLCKDGVAFTILKLKGLCGGGGGASGAESYGSMK